MWVLAAKLQDRLMVIKEALLLLIVLNPLVVEVVVRILVVVGQEVVLVDQVVVEETLEDLEPLTKDTVEVLVLVETGH